MAWQSKETPWSVSALWSSVNPEGGNSVELTKSEKNKIVHLHLCTSLYCWAHRSRRSCHWRAGLPAIHRNSSFFCNHESNTTNQCLDTELCDLCKEIVPINLAIALSIPLLQGDKIILVASLLIWTLFCLLRVKREVRENLSSFLFAILTRLPLAQLPWFWFFDWWIDFDFIVQYVVHLFTHFIHFCSFLSLIPSNWFHLVLFHSIPFHVIPFQVISFHSFNLTVLISFVVFCNHSFFIDGLIDRLIHWLIDEPIGCLFYWSIDPFGCSISIAMTSSKKCTVKWHRWCP